MTSGEPGGSDCPGNPRGGPPVVVHLLHTVAYGGIETILINWLRVLPASRIRVQLVVFALPDHGERAFVEMAERAGIGVRTIPWSARKPVFSSARTLARILEEIGADIVHTHNVYAELVGYFAARRTGAKVLTTHYVWADFGFKRNVQQRISAHLVRRFDLVTSQCRMTLEEGVRRGIPRDRSRVLISGYDVPDRSMDPSSRRERRAALGVGDEHVVLANVARFYPEKAHDLLLRAFARIREQRPDARLWLFGVGPLEAQLRDQARRLDLGEDILFRGFQADLDAELELADIQVHASHAEGVPLAICGGMSAALPIVATNVGGIPEMIAHGESGLLIEPGDEDALVRECVRLIDDPGLRSGLGGAARRFIETDYSLATAVDALAKTYEDLLCA